MCVTKAHPPAKNAQRMVAIQTYNQVLRLCVCASVLCTAASVVFDHTQAHIESDIVRTADTTSTLCAVRVKQ